tara:strand:- start:1780 stop:2667 length:888 start_codon:yes stop_codon:yes gene_type:complete
MDKIKIVGISVNPALLEQINEINSDNFSENTTKKHSSLIDNAQCLLRSLSTKEKNVFFYNTSIYNLILALIFKFKRKHIIFHLHDPVPHSGILNPFIFIINFLMTYLSNKVLVFSEKLKKQVHNFYFKKNVFIVSHGFNRFIYKPTIISENIKLTIGIIGRNMPYKGFDEFLLFSKNNLEISFYCIGKGYPKVDLENLTYFDGYIERNKYYSLIQDLDFVYFSHKNISYSGVLNDCKVLKKRVMVESYNLIKLKDFNLKLYSASNVKNYKKSKIKNFEIDFGWNDYRETLLKLTI